MSSPAVPSSPPPEPFRTYAEKLEDPRWQKRRLKILEQRNFKCENPRCVSPPTMRLDVDHAFYDRRRDPWDYPDESLWVFCKDCHKLAGRLRLLLYYQLSLFNPCLIDPDQFEALRSTEDTARLDRIAPLTVDDLAAEFLEELRRRDEQYWPPFKVKP